MVGYRNGVSSPSLPTAHFPTAHSPLPIFQLLFSKLINISILPAQRLKDEFDAARKASGECTRRRSGGLPQGLPVRRAFCVGMAGSGMQAVAEWLVAAGWQVSGSDRTTTPAMIEHFRTLGVRLDLQGETAQLPPQLDLLIYSPAVPENNAERVAARARGIAELSYPQALGELMRSRPASQSPGRMARAPQPPSWGICCDRPVTTRRSCAGPGC